MNELLLMLGIESWKPLLTALVLPPLPVFLLLLIGVRLVLRWRGFGWTLVLLSVALLWLGSTVGAAEAVQSMTRAPAVVMTESRLAELRKQVSASPANKPAIAIVVLGGGREPLAPEYGVASLRDESLARLRYGLHLGRATGAPVMFSGGVGHADTDAVAEADVAADIAAREFGRPLRWVESRSRDTRENARFTATLLREAGVQQVILVTHGWHMKRALRAFSQESKAQGAPLTLVPAPMALAPRSERPVLRWLPTGEGTILMRRVLREQLGLLMGA
jgi:uncharacterized SAM-binding protein YcdF (DUF218 family)